MLGLFLRHVICHWAKGTSNYIVLKLFKASDRPMQSMNLHKLALRSCDLYSHHFESCCLLKLCQVCFYSSCRARTYASNHSFSIYLPIFYSVPTLSWLLGIQQWTKQTKVSASLRLHFQWTSLICCWCTEAISDFSQVSLYGKISYLYLVAG